MDGKEQSCEKSNLALEPLNTVQKVFRQYTDRCCITVKSQSNYIFAGSANRPLFTLIVIIFFCLSPLTIIFLNTKFRYHYSSVVLSKKLISVSTLIRDIKTYVCTRSGYRVISSCRNPGGRNSLTWAWYPPEMCTPKVCTWGSAIFVSFS